MIIISRSFSAIKLLYEILLIELKKYVCEYDTINYQKLMPHYYINENYYDDVIICEKNTDEICNVILNCAIILFVLITIFNKTFMKMITIIICVMIF